MSKFSHDDDAADDDARTMIVPRFSSKKRPKNYETGRFLICLLVKQAGCG